MCRNIRFSCQSAIAHKRKAAPKDKGAAVALVAMEDRAENDDNHFDTDECSDSEHHHHNPTVDIQRGHPDGVRVGKQILDSICNPAAQPLRAAQYTWPVEARIDIVGNPERESYHADSGELKHFFEHYSPFLLVISVRSYLTCFFYYNTELVLSQYIRVLELRLCAIADAV